MRQILLRAAAAIFSLCAALLIGGAAFALAALGSFFGDISLNGKPNFVPISYQLYLGVAPFFVFALVCLMHFAVLAFFPRRRFSLRTLMLLARLEVIALLIASGCLLFFANTDNHGIAALLFGVILVQSVLLWALTWTLPAAAAYDSGDVLDARGGDDFRFEPRRAFKSAVKYFLVWPLKAFSALLVAFIVLNGFDRKLSQQSQDMMQVPANPYKSGDNLYVAMLGIDAPPGQDTIRFAQDRIAAYEETQAAPAAENGAKEAAKDKHAAAPTLPFYGNIEFCNPAKVSVWRAAATHRAEIERLVQTNAVLLQRYEALHEVPGFHDPTSRNISGGVLLTMPGWIRKLYLAVLASKLQSGNVAQQKEALDDMRRDIIMLHQVMVESDQMLWKLIASAYLQADYLLLADMSADRSFELKNLTTELDRLLAPFNMADWRIGNTADDEFRQRLPLWKAARAGKETLNNTDPDAHGSVVGRAWNRALGLLVQVNATTNLSAQHWAALGRALNVSPQELAASHEAYLARERDDLSLGLGYLYNPAGKLLVAVDAQSSDVLYDYALRSYDAAAVQRLARLAYELRKQRIAPAGVGAFMQQHPQWASHPVDGRLFSWDPEKHALAVNPLGQWKHDQRLGVAL